jgi:hypothetical protein
MIAKPLEAITAADLQALVTGQFAESKTLEYKRELPGESPNEKIKFLAGVSSLANTQGGDFVIGIDAPKGLPVAVSGVPLEDPDATKARLEDILRSGLQPRLPRIDIRVVPIHSEGHVVLLRVTRSWLAPHRVVLAGHDQFYGRTSAGKYRLDVGELRAAFLQSETLAERIRAFRAGRLTTIISGETPLRLNAGAKLVLHILPITAFAGDQRLDVSGRVEALRQVQPLGSSGWDHRINVDGVVTFDRSDQAETYTQIFRNGAVEAVEVFVPRDGDRRLIPSVAYEQNVMRAARDYVGFLQQEGAGFPMFVFLALIELRGYGLALPPGFWPEIRLADRDTVILPEAVIEGPEFDRAVVLRPLLDMVWNAFGLPRSANFDAGGHWKPRP